MSAAANAAATSVNSGLVTVCRILAGITFTGAAAAALGFTPMHKYRDEVEFAAQEPQVLNPVKHRCNDRLEDVMEVLLAEDGNVWKDFRPACGNWISCLRSSVGKEPTMPYRQRDGRPGAGPSAGTDGAEPEFSKYT